MIIVFGSINLDTTFAVSRLPEAGETILSQSYMRSNGGKGANQALAASRLGAKVVLIGCTGDDQPGKNILTSLRRGGVVTSGVSRSDQNPTGAAVIAYDSQGENHIIVNPGANLDARQDQIPDEIMNEGNMILMQMEVLPEENWKLIKRAKEHGVKTMLNLAPAAELPEEAFKDLDYLIINEIEAKQVAESLDIAQSENIQEFAASIAEKGNLTCIVTLGKLGSIAVTPERKLIVVPTLQVEKVVDRTGAGDCFCGTLAAALYDGKSLKESLRMASVAGALSCQKQGTQSSYVYVGDIEDHLPNLPEFHEEQL